MNHRNGRRETVGVSKPDSLLQWARGLSADRREAATTVSHELQAPLAIILALCDRLETRTTPGPADVEDIERIRANAYTLVRRIQELMQITELDGGHVELETTDLDVTALVRECAEGFRSVAEQRGQRLIITLPDQPLRAYIDRRHVQSIVSNLLANAIRHTSSNGHVRCGLRAQRRMLTIEVADSGPGVPPNMRGRIFDRYSHERGGAGSGIGLAIVRELVALHNGAIRVGEAPEGGALFTATLNVRFAPRGARRRASTEVSEPLSELQRATVEALREELGVRALRHRFARRGDAVIGPRSANSPPT
jgi:signal transduction histidine kinase